MTDYIPREAVLEFVEPDARPFLAERIKSIPAADVVERASGIIGVIPTADVRPVVRASWERKEKDGVWWYACSVCGEHIPKGRWGQEWYSNFCPNCGARIEES